MQQTRRLHLNVSDSILHAVQHGVFRPRIPFHSGGVRELPAVACITQTCHGIA
jgi:hypothetical protein